MKKAKAFLKNAAIVLGATVLSVIVSICLGNLASTYIIKKNNMTPVPWSYRVI